MEVFEDAGYFCVDNLPPEMIRSLAELFRHAGSKVERAAVVSDVARRRVLRRPSPACSTSSTRRASRTGCCSSKPTSRRCSPATRRRAAAIRWPRTAAWPTASRAERALLGPVRDARRRSASTPSGLSAAALRRKIADELLRARRARQARRHLHVLRPQARPAARRRPRLRRALPAQPALRGRAAAAHRPRPARRRVHRRATARSRSSTSASCRCSTTCCRSTSPRARRT